MKIVSSGGTCADFTRKTLDVDSGGVYRCSDMLYASLEPLLFNVVATGEETRSHLHSLFASFNSEKKFAVSYLFP